MGKQHLVPLPLSFILEGSLTSATNIDPTGVEPLVHIAKRPALQQEPNVYLEPKWLRCHPIPSKSTYQALQSHQKNVGLIQ